MNALAPSHDAQQLGIIIQLPGSPLRVTWLKVSPQKPSAFGPSDFSVLAVVEYLQADAQAMTAKLGPPSDHEPIAITEAEVMALFGAELAQRFPQVGGSLRVIPGTQYSAALFARAPLLHGKVAALPGGTTFFVSLFTT